jgi:hypothetical protein
MGCLLGKNRVQNKSTPRDANNYTRCISFNILVSQKSIP